MDSLFFHFSLFTSLHFFHFHFHFTINFSGVVLVPLAIDDQKEEVASRPPLFGLTPLGVSPFVQEVAPKG